MSSPETLEMIKFKSISAQLSDCEMDVLMTRLWRSVGRDRILQFLCISLSKFTANQKYVDIISHKSFRNVTQTMNPMTQ